MSQTSIELVRANVLEAVLFERERQDGLWGDQSNHSDAWWTVIAASGNGGVAKTVYEQNITNTYLELIQVCAVYFAWAEAILRRAE